MKAKPAMKRFLVLFLTLLLVGCSTAPNSLHSTQSGLDLTDDPDNCGAEGYACANGRSCVSSLCTPAWQDISDGGIGVGYAQGATLDGKFLVVGGFSDTGSGNSLTTTQVYDPSGDTWTTVSDLNSARGQFTASFGPEGVFAYGGLGNVYEGGSDVPGVEVLFDLAEGWVSVPIDQTNVPYGVASTWTGTSFFTYGGAGSETVGGLLTLGDLWNPTTCSHDFCGINGKYTMFFDKKVVHVFGGNSPTTNGLLFDVPTSTWYNWGLPSDTPDFSSVITNQPKFGDDGQRIFYLGNAPSVLIYDRETESWGEDLATQPTGLCDEAAASWVGSELFAWGGICGGVISSVGGRYQPPAPGL
jgi:hypothetical protein